MNEQEYWNRFKKTGHVADYMQYKNAVSGKTKSDTPEAGLNTGSGGGPNVDNNSDRRPDYT